MGMQWHVSQKGTPTLSIVTLKGISGFLRFFGVNIPVAAGHQLAIQFPTSPGIEYHLMASCFRNTSAKYH